LVSGATVELSSDILLTSAVSVNMISGLTINGNKFSIDGGGLYRCFEFKFCTSLTINNLRVVNGNDLTSDNGFGSGMVLFSTTAALNSCIFTGHQAFSGAAIYVALSPSTISMTSCTVSFNSATGFAAGVFVSSDCKLVMSSCTMSHNQVAGHGGALYVLSGDATLTLCTISYNIASGLFAGAGIYAVSGTGLGASVTLISCTITHNTAYFGSALYAGSVTGDATLVLEITRTTLSNNAATARNSGLYLMSIDAGKVTAAGYGLIFSGNTSPYGIGEDVYLSGWASSFQLSSLCMGDTYNAGTGTLSCFGCTSTLAADLSGSCTSCSSGYFACCGSSVCSGGISSSECHTDACVSCPAGKFLWKSVFCESCSAGRFSAVGAFLCTHCLSGFYQPTAGSSTCTSCAAGRYVFFLRFLASCVCYNTRQH
jgi:hypothetical protein